MCGMTMWDGKQSNHISATVQARRLSQFGHIARMSDESDAKQVLTASPCGELETTGMPPYYVDEDYPAGPGITEPLLEWSSWRGSESSTLENDVYVWHYALMVVHARNEWMSKWVSRSVMSQSKKTFY